MPLPKVKLPLDYNVFRKAFANEVTRVTKVPCVLEETTTQDTPRPTNPALTPYFSFKITTPGAKSGDDAQTFAGDGTVQGRGGQRKMVVSFHCYSREQEDAYNLMALWQASLELQQTQENLRKAGIAVWVIGNVADLSALLNTGYEGRSHMDVSFGVASNLTQDLSEIDTAEVTGLVNTDQGIVKVGPIDLKTV